MNDLVKDTHEGEEEKKLNFRPQSFDDYVGQKSVVDNIEVMVMSALRRKAPLDHILFCGPPGLGKTSLAMLVSSQMNAKLHVISGPALERKADLAAVLTNLAPNDVLFIDEIHRMHISIEEILYSALEDFRLDIILGQGASARTMQIGLNPFTLIGATTRAGLLSNPLRDRFHCLLNFDYYNEEELQQIILKNSYKLEIQLNQLAVSEIARRSRGTPRIALRLLRRIRDFAVVADEIHDKVSQHLVQKALKMLRIDGHGLDSMDLKILQTIKDVYQCGPVGIEALAATLAEDKGTLEDVHEPYLLKEGYLLRTPRGRVLSEKAITHLKDAATSL